MSVLHLSSGSVLKTTIIVLTLSILCRENATARAEGASEAASSSESPRTFELEDAPEPGVSDRAPSLQWEVTYKEAVALATKGQYARAVALAEKAVDLARAAPGVQGKLAVATSLNRLAAIEQQQARYDPAEAHYKQALALRQRLLGHEHGEVAQTLNYLAGLYTQRARYALAASHYTQMAADALAPVLRENGKSERAALLDQRSARAGKAN